jgi:hypothetical protein
MTKPIYWGDPKAKPAEIEKLMARTREASVEEITELAKLAGERHREITEVVKAKMNRPDAQRIRHLRCVEGHSWRSVAGITYMEWGGTFDDWYPATNQR